MSGIRAVILDLDKTLLRSDRTISLYTQSVLRRCREKGVRIVIATARPPRGIRLYEEMIRPDAVVVMNGASVRMGGRDQRSVTISAEQVQALIRDIERLLPGRSWSFEAESGFYANFDTTTVWKGDPARRVTAESMPHEPAYKVIVGLEDGQDASVLRAILPEGTYLEIADGVLGMAMHREATKLNGVRMALKEMNIGFGEAAAFGDDLADIGMLQACCFGVAVDNALPEVKAAADCMTASNDEDGVAAWLERYAGI